MFYLIYLLTQEYVILLSNQPSCDENCNTKAIYGSFREAVKKIEDKTGNLLDKLQSKLYRAVEHIGAEVVETI